MDSDVGLAAFALVVNGTKRAPLRCANEAWEFPAFAEMPAPTVSIENTGAAPIAYVAVSGWSVAAGYLPGIASGGPGELVGVLAPGAHVDISAMFSGPAAAGSSSCVALLGSAATFAAPSARTMADEASIAWPPGVPGSGGASDMHLAEIEVETACTRPFRAW